MAAAPPASSSTQGAATVTAAPNAKTYWWLIGLGAALVVGLCFLSSFCAGPTSIAIMLSTAGALSLITGGAVAIERVLEAFWTLVDMTVGATWPAAPLDAEVHGGSTKVQGALDALKKALASPDLNTSQLSAEAAAIGARVETIRSTLRALEAPVDAATRSDVLARVNGAIDTLAKDHPNVFNVHALGDALNDCGTSVTILQQALDTFGSHPARRLVSILAGAFLGLLAAFLLRLNVYAAVNTSTAAASAAPSVWIAITGLVMGLGSTPTHELIKALQSKKSDKSAG